MQIYVSLLKEAGKNPGYTHIHIFENRIYKLLVQVASGCLNVLFF